MVELKKKEDVSPVCPHCNTDIREVWFNELRTDFGRRYIYFCSKCKKVLGVTHRKGFWMG
ncbi:MAG: hypothetical protein K9J12_13720 [Melioribacteraceae bacterium]|nr:hypothetical protein [Melioribacteraceae bacterium]MCF8263178.1 hypothetical protein [Melioribacteraceae bacterium]MCF8414044.1 hypothetical protein [Melioribacteraceae bacterium]MCF8430334.1 hypothetical protein [Melioribacteraceae bacterium]